MSKTSSIKVDAFSIIEVVVALSITGVIVGILFVILSAITDRIVDYRDQNQLVNDMNRFSYTINKDIFDNHVISQEDTEIRFEGYSGNGSKYSFFEDYVIRDNSVFVDTFGIRVKTIVIDTIKSSSGLQAFQRLRFKMVQNDQEIDYKFYKEFSSVELLKNNVEK